MEDKERARSLWTSLIKLPGHGSRAEYWIPYIQFEQLVVRHFIYMLFSFMECCFYLYSELTENQFNIFHFM